MVAQDSSSLAKAVPKRGLWAKRIASKFPGRRLCRWISGASCFSLNRRWNWGIGRLGRIKLLKETAVYCPMKIIYQAVFADAAEVCVRYGTASGNLTEQTAWQQFPAGEPAELTLQNLAAGTRYFYQLCHRAPGAPNPLCPERTFHTQRPAGSAFTFTVQADPHLDERSDTALYRRCLQNQLEDAPDFMVDLGDIFMSDKMKNAKTKSPTTR